MTATRTPAPLSRRRFLASSATTAAAAWLAPGLLYAQDADSSKQPDVVVQGRATAATAKITTQKLRNNVAVLMGSGGNIAVLTGPEGKLLVDSGISTSRPQLTEALNALSPDPLHTSSTPTGTTTTPTATPGSTPPAPPSSPTRSAPSASAPRRTSPPSTPTSPPPPPAPSPPSSSPPTTPSNSTARHLSLTHYDPAHTDTDISVLFADADILHTGDTWFNGFYPFIDYSTGGHIDGMIRATKRNLAVGTSSTIIIPGHGPVGNKTQLQDFHDMLVGCRESVAAVKKQGKSVDETIAAKPTAAFDAKWGNGFMKPDVFTRLVYQGV